jgi:aminoglycoside phosphotransferase family enzyme
MAGADPVAAATRAKLAALADPATYPDAPAHIERLETHFAWLFFTERHAWKLKKPMQLRGADLRSLAAREHDCREELRLNRRLAADTYLGVVPLVDTGTRLALGGPGETVDWLVQMRMLAREHMLDARLRAGSATAAELRRVAQTLATFHRDAVPESLAPHELETRLRARVAEAVHELGQSAYALPPEPLAALAAALAASLDRLRGELPRRVAARRVVDAHGDLRAEHVWMGPRVQIIDALEFDRELRVLDRAEDMAMLVHDVERLGYPAAAAELRAAWLAAVPDDATPQLFDGYLAVRAATRAKVAIWHLDEPRGAADSEHWRRRALEAIGSALRYAARCVGHA